ncbi:MAG: hypothetical protein QFF03_04595, partial [Pseudomonadota bacterium]|nr:hypothetical protein [Pseudomonadota bacterium]
NREIGLFRMRPDLVRNLVKKSVDTEGLRRSLLDNRGARTVRRAAPSAQIGGHRQEAIMRMIIAARIEGSMGCSEPIRLAEFERADGELKQLGLSLAEGRSLRYEAQRALVNVQAQVFVVASMNCSHCGAALSIKAKHTLRYRTVFGKVSTDSPQLRICKCSQGTGNKSFSPLALAMPLRVSPELEYLQVKWAAHLPYAVAATLSKETLPVDQAVSTSGLRNRVWAVGQELDDKAESAIRGERAYRLSDSKVKIVALAVDSAWLLHRPSRQEEDEAKLSQYFPSKRPPPTGQHVNIIAGRAVRDGSGSDSRAERRPENARNA